MARCNFQTNLYKNSLSTLTHLFSI